MTKILKNIEQKLGFENLPGKILEKLSGSELNSFLLELFRARASKITPPEVLKDFRQNRFCATSTVNPVVFKQDEVLWLAESEKYGFKPVMLSPLTSLGTCSSAAFVDQNNIVSAVRGTEVVSDATNVLALKIASDIKDEKKDIIKYSTTHRHTRGQYFTNPLFSAHFGLFCMATAGKDKGSFSFELENLEEHLKFYLQMLKRIFKDEDITLTIYCDDFERAFNGKLFTMIENFAKTNNTAYNWEEKKEDYYAGIRFKYFVRYNGAVADIIDGGMVNWTQKFLSDKKQRLLTSAAGLELLSKMSLKQ